MKKANRILFLMIVLIGLVTDCQDTKKTGSNTDTILLELLLQGNSNGEYEEGALPNTLQQVPPKDEIPLHSHIMQKPISIVFVEPKDGAVHFPVIGGGIKVHFNRKLDCSNPKLGMEIRPMTPNRPEGSTPLEVTASECLDDYTASFKGPDLLPDQFYQIKIYGIKDEFAYFYGNELEPIHLFVSTGSEPYIQQYDTFDQIADTSHCTINGSLSTTDFSQGNWRPKIPLMKGEPEGQMFTLDPHQKIIVHAVNNCQSGYYRFRILAWSYPDKMPTGMDHFFLTVRNMKTKRYEGLWSIPAKPMVSPERYEVGEKFVYLEKGETDFEVEWMNDIASETGRSGIASNGIDIIDAYIDANHLPGKIHIPGGEYRKADQFCSLQGEWDWGFFNGNVNGSNPVYMKYLTGNTYGSGNTTGFCYSGLAKGKYRFSIRAISPMPLPLGFTAYTIKVSTTAETVTYMSLPASASEFQNGFVDLEIPGPTAHIKISLAGREAGEEMNRQDPPFSYRYVRLETVDE